MLLVETPCNRIYSISSIILCKSFRTKICRIMFNLIMIYFKLNYNRIPLNSEDWILKSVLCYMAICVMLYGNVKQQILTLSITGIGKNLFLSFNIWSWKCKLNKKMTTSKYHQPVLNLFLSIKWLILFPKIRLPFLCHIQFFFILSPTI